MQGQATNNGAFGLMVLGLIATTLMFLTFAMTGMNLLDRPAAATAVENQAEVRSEEQRLRELRDRIAEYRVRHPTRAVAGEPDIEQLRARIRVETENAARLKRDLADAGMVSVGRIYGAARGNEVVQYVECVEGAAVMQPQGTRFATSDTQNLAKVLPPGHVALLVRPGGFQTFTTVRDALSRRPDLKLGYLPVERGWRLDYRTDGG